MSFLGSLFGKKETLTNCDWCGTDFSGEGVEADGLTYCGARCIKAKNAPATERRARDVHKAKKLTLDDARAALGIARSEVRFLRKTVIGSLESELGAAPPNLEAEINQREHELWRSLDDIREALIDAGRDVSAYDALRERSVVNSIELRHGSETDLGVGLRGPTLVTTHTVTADFAAGNIERMRDAIGALDQALS